MLYHLARVYCLEGTTQSCTGRAKLEVSEDNLPDDEETLATPGFKNYLFLLSNARNFSSNVRSVITSIPKLFVNPGSRCMLGYRLLATVLSLASIPQRDQHFING